MLQLYSKEGFTFNKNENNNYSLTFEMENKHMILSQIIDFNLVKLIYDLNPDIYEKANLNIINENEATVALLMKHLFEDLGLPQRFSYVHVAKTTHEHSIVFEAKTIKTERPEGMPTEAELTPLKKMLCECNIVNPHKICFTTTILFESHMTIPTVVEKLVGIILFKIFNRVKRFIENVRM